MVGGDNLLPVIFIAASFIEDCFGQQPMLEARTTFKNRFKFNTPLLTFDARVELQCPLTATFSCSGSETIELRFGGGVIDKKPCKINATTDFHLEPNSKVGLYECALNSIPYARFNLSYRFCNDNSDTCVKAKCRLPGDWWCITYASSGSVPCTKLNYEACKESLKGNNVYSTSAIDAICNMTNTAINVDQKHDEASPYIRSQGGQVVEGIILFGRSFKHVIGKGPFEIFCGERLSATCQIGLIDESNPDASQVYDRKGPCPISIDLDSSITGTRVLGFWCMVTDGAGYHEELHNSIAVFDTTPGPVIRQPVVSCQPKYDIGSEFNVSYLLAGPFSWGNKYNYTCAPIVEYHTCTPHNSFSIQLEPSILTIDEEPTTDTEPTTSTRTTSGAPALMCFTDLLIIGLVGNVIS